MTTQSSMLHVRMDTEMKQKATAALAAMGLTASYPAESTSRDSS